jgi:hypothetical protein
VPLLLKKSSIALVLCTSMLTGSLRASAEDLDYTIEVVDTTPPEDDCPFGETDTTWSPYFNASGLTSDRREWDLFGATGPLNDYIILDWNVGLDCDGMPVDPTGSVSASYVADSPLDVTSLDCSGESDCIASSKETVDFEIDIPAETPTGEYDVRFTLTWTP